MAHPGHIRLPPGTIVVSLVRDGSLLFPEGSTTLFPGDHVTVAARARHAGEARAALGFEPTEA